MNVGSNTGIHEYQSGSQRNAVWDVQYRWGLNSGWIVFEKEKKKDLQLECIIQNQGSFISIMRWPGFTCQDFLGFATHISAQHDHLNIVQSSFPFYLFIYLDSHKLFVLFYLILYQRNTLLRVVRYKQSLLKMPEGKNESIGQPVPRLWPEQDLWTASKTVMKLIIDIQAHSDEFLTATLKLKCVLCVPDLCKVYKKHF